MDTNNHHYNQYKQLSLLSIQTSIIIINTKKHHYYQYKQASLSSVQPTIIIINTNQSDGNGIIGCNGKWVWRRGFCSASANITIKSERKGRENLKTVMK